MTRSRLRSLVALVLLAGTAVHTSAKEPIEDHELLRRIEQFETTVEGTERKEVRLELRRFASEMVNTSVRVTSGVVASTYERQNESNIYFGLNYDPEDHIYLRDPDPELDARFRNHRLWVSVIRTFPDRQLSFELPIDAATFGRLETGRTIGFTCTIAVVIRGKSVYCRPTSLRDAVH